MQLVAEAESEIAKSFKVEASLPEQRVSIVTERVERGWEGKKKKFVWGKRSGKRGLNSLVARPTPSKARHDDLQLSTDSD